MPIGPGPPLDALIGSEIAQVTANDVDSGPPLWYLLTIDGSPGSTFSIFRYGGHIWLTEPLDYEERASYTLTIQTSDGKHQTRADVRLNLQDVNDNAPEFRQSLYQVTVMEHTQAWTPLVTISATDRDSGEMGRVIYKVLSSDTGSFHIDPNNGTLFTIEPMELDTSWPVVDVLVEARDKGSPSLASLVTVQILVLDVNDHVPTFPQAQYMAAIPEDLSLGSTVLILEATDADLTPENSVLDYTILSGNVGNVFQLLYTVVELPAMEPGLITGRDVFSVNRTSGELLSRQSFDYERSKTFSMVIKATDAGNFSATVTVQVLVMGEDEYDPVFVTPYFSFEVPEGANKGQIIGLVQATDEDEGADGVVLYSFSKPSPYFGINETTGQVYLKVDGQRHRSGRSKRETREMTLEVHAHSPLPSSRVAMAQLTVDITHTSFGLAPDLNLLLIVSVASSLAVVVVLAAVAIILVVCRSRGMQKKSEEADAQLDNLQSSTLQRMGHDKSGLGSGDRIYHQTLPGYSMDSSAVDGPYTRGGSLDPSHSSGRGSAEAAEDDEIRMINEYPRVASITSSMQEHISARGPDSGIQQDADQLSDISCDPSMDSGQWFKNKKGSGQATLYRDDSGGGGAFMGVGCRLNMSHPKDYSFPEDGKPSVEGSLTAIVASDEELRGSYNWDYLLNWCPQFQPLASVFMEIARLKDESALRKTLPA
ncbi:unnamed protein product [Ranitomeya imitator]|uniref:Cadherin domain-containing protein n=1 Tax=Ranitomeya imitator TaxID=111125 RepID=A0ABN9MFX9_9NEOB|nr:unnamed protein product [Ranitomeya imitator]